MRGGLALPARLGAADLARFARFCVVGGLTAGVYMVSLNLVALAARWPVAMASLVAYPLTIAFNYALHRFWTFPDRRQGRAETLRYLVLVSLCALLNAGLLSLANGLAGLAALAYEFAVMGLGVVMTFAGMNLWVWKRPAG